MLNNITKKQIVIIIFTIIIIVVLYFIYNQNNKEDNEILLENILIENKIDNQNKNQNVLIIHITGEVKNPGIVKLPLEARIEDAVLAAGGLTEDADITKVNLAYILEDGIKIRIPSKVDSEKEEIITENSGEIIIKEENNEFSKIKNSININKASIDEIQKLPGIGASLANRIIKYREETGKFKDIEDIKNVSGIGENKFEQIKDLISVK